MARFYLLVCFLISGCALLELKKPSSSESDRDLASLDPAPSVTTAPSSSKEASLKNIEDSSKQALRKRVLVLPFRNLSGIGNEELSAFAAEEFKNKLSQLDDFILVRDSDVRGLGELLSSGAEPDMNALIEKARAHGVVAIVMGSIKDVQIKEKGNQVGLFQTRYNTVNTSLEVKLIDVITQKTTVEKSTSAEVTEENTRFFGSRSIASTDGSRAEGAVTQAIEQLIPSFASEAQRIGWTGRIAKIDVHRFFINAGELSGVKRNQLLRVFGEAEPVVDKESGLNIGMAPGKFKGLLKVVDFFGEDGAIAILHSGAGFQEKDRVEAYTPPPP